MKKTYIFSCYMNRPHPALKRRPWWNLFGRDRIVMQDRQTRIVIHGIPEDEAQILMDAPASAAWRLFIRLLGGPVWMVQLEEASTDGVQYATSQYVATTTYRE